MTPAAHQKRRLTALEWHRRQIARIAQERETDSPSPGTKERALDQRRRALLAKHAEQLKLRRWQCLNSWNRLDAAKWRLVPGGICPNRPVRGQGPLNFWMREVNRVVGRKARLQPSGSGYVVEGFASRPTAPAVDHWAGRSAVGQSSSQEQQSLLQRHAVARRAVRILPGQSRQRRRAGGNRRSSYVPSLAGRGSGPFRAHRQACEIARRASVLLLSRTNSSFWAETPLTTRPPRRWPVP